MEIHVGRVLLVFGLLACGGLFPASAAASDSKPSRPNIVFIVSDDQRWDSLDAMPKLSAAHEWARFTNSFVNDPQCCPSRATIFTGRYTQHTGVETLRDGADLDDRRTIASLLHDAGYRTGLYGKYLNGYPFGRGYFVPAGWDEFAPGATDYFKYRQYQTGGERVEHGSAPDDYATDVLTAQSRKFIRTTDKSQPLFLYTAFNAPHFSALGNHDPIPAPRDAGSCARTAIEHPANFNAHDTVSEPAWMSVATGNNVEDTERRQRATCEALRGVDRGVMSIIAELRRADPLQNTYVIFMSDNGYSFGEHRLDGKGHLYEESIRVPLLVRGPGVAPKPVERLTSNVDLAPTILEWARVRPPANFIDGHSFAAALRGESGSSDPKEVLLRGCRTGRNVPNTPCGGYHDDMGLNWGLRTATHKYIENSDGFVQLFDLRRDPFELTNLASDPAQAGLIADLGVRLARLRDT